MSLWLMKTVPNCLGYIDYKKCYQHTPPLWGPDGLIYNGNLVTCPRHYMQTTGNLANFFYEPGADKLIAHVILTTIYWPGWDARRYEFDAATGQWTNADPVLSRDPDTFIGIWGAAWTGGATMGSYGKIYACRRSETAIREISWKNAEPVDGGWSVDPYTWNPKSIYGYAIVNRADNTLAAVSSWTLDCWRNISVTPERFAQLRLPNVLGYLAYESRNYCWVITKDGVVLKADYQIPRWEMISKVNKPEVSSTGYAIAFDTKRKQVVVLRLRPDAADGFCQHQLEFYYPMVSPAQLTQPVPVTSLKAGKRVILVAHLIGEAGEGITPYTVNAVLQEPVEGRLVTPFSGTELGGRVCFQYQAPDVACEETLTLETTVEETI